MGGGRGWGGEGNTEIFGYKFFQSSFIIVFVNDQITDSS